MFVSIKTRINYSIVLLFTVVADGLNAAEYSCSSAYSSTGYEVSLHGDRAGSYLMVPGQVTHEFRGRELSFYLRSERNSSQVATFKVDSGRFGDRKLTAGKQVEWELGQAWPDASSSLLFNADDFQPRRKVHGGRVQFQVANVGPSESYPCVEGSITAYFEGVTVNVVFAMTADGYDPNLAN
jgi:hypothetical protein